MRPAQEWSNSDDHPDKRPRLEPEAIRSSPRLNRSTPDHTHHANVSPRKRQRPNKVPQPSPRMATRASMKTESTAGLSAGKALDLSEGIFSPTSFFGTSPAGGNAQGEGEGEVDIESLLAQFASDQPGFDLDALFAGGGGDREAEQGVMDLLSGWEGAAGGASGSAVQNKEGTG